MLITKASSSLLTALAALSIRGRASPTDLEAAYNRTSVQPLSGTTSSISSGTSPGSSGPPSSLTVATDYQAVPFRYNAQSASSHYRAGRSSSSTIATESNCSQTSMAQSASSTLIPNQKSSNLLSTSQEASQFSTILKSPAETKKSFTESISQPPYPLSSAPAASSPLPENIVSNHSVGTTVLAGKSGSSSKATPSAASPMLLSLAESASKLAASKAVNATNCNDGTWDLTIANYLKANTDANLQTWWHGGTDNETGVKFPAKSSPGTLLTETLAKDFEPVGSELICTLESHTCQPAHGCTSYAVHIPEGVPQSGTAKFFHEIGPASHYSWFAIHSIANVFSFAETFVSGLTSAGIQIASENLQLTEIFTKDVNMHVATRSLLAGFSVLIAILFAFVPVVGQVVHRVITAEAIAGTAAIAATALGTTGGFLGLEVAKSPGMDAKAAAFGEYISIIFNNTAAAIDELLSKLMNGEAVDAASGVTEPSLFGILHGGLWVNSSVNTSPNLSISAMTDLTRDDIVSRGINSIWSQSKIYVTYANLSDDSVGSKCQADRNGWQASKTCAHGGVYYLYHFREHHHLNGNLAYPQGADEMMKAPFNLQPSWVTAGSAASYRAQNNGSGGFAYNQSDTSIDLIDTLTKVGKTGTLDSLRTMPGVWNISVCDMGSHNDWNGDFTSKPMVTENKSCLKFFFPCCCGPGCLQTRDFVRSAQMDGFKTIVHTCRKQLRSCTAWPPGVASIDFGKAGTITNQTCVN